MKNDLIRIGWIAALCLWAWVGEPHTASAEPNVRVRAESRIEIGVEYVGQRLQVRGALRDERGAPLPGVEVLVTLRSDEGDVIERREVTTNVHGRFVVERVAPHTQIVLQAAYAGDQWHRGVRVERRIDQARADVRLELQLPDKGLLDLDAKSIPIRVLAESDSGGHALPMTLRDEAGRVLAQGKTDALGRLTWDLPTEALGAPGAGQLQLESSGDRTRSEAQTEARVVRFRRTQLQLRRSDATAEAGRATHVSGELRTRAGPRKGVPVGLFLDEAHATTAITGPDGEFRAELWPGSEGTYEVVARVERDPAGAYTAASRSLRLEVAPPGSLPWRWLLFALLPGAALAGMRWMLARRDGATERSPSATLVPGVQTAPRTRLRPTETLLSGQIVHARTGAPVREARVVASLRGQAERLTNSDPQGRFAFPGCEHPVMLTIHAPGFADLTTWATCPHRGEWRDCEIRLESLRDRAARPFRKLVVPRLPSALSFNLWTPREIGRALRHDMGPAIEELSRDVEAASFAHPPPSAADIDAIREKAAALSPEPGLSAGLQHGSTRPDSRR